MNTILSIILTASLILNSNFPSLISFLSSHLHKEYNPMEISLLVEDSKELTALLSMLRYVPLEEPEEEETIIEESKIQEEIIETVVVHPGKLSVAEEMAQRPNMVGRWTIPSVNIDVACFNSSAQSVADGKDSAVYFRYWEGTIIADHWNQGFETIKQCVPGTLAYFNNGEEVKEYICTGYTTGHNTGYNLTDDNYIIITCNPDEIILYTCNGCWQNVWIVFFQAVE